MWSNAKGEFGCLIFCGVRHLGNTWDEHLDIRAIGRPVLSVDVQFYRLVGA